MPVKERSDDEVMRLLEQHKVTESVTKRAAWEKAKEQLACVVPVNIPGLAPVKVGHFLEEFAKQYGFTNWGTLEYLLSRRKRILKAKAKEQKAPAKTKEKEPLFNIEDYTKGQQKYLKKVLWRKDKITSVVREKRSIVVIHETKTGNQVAYKVSPTGSEKYVGTVKTST